MIDWLKGRGQLHHLLQNIFKYCPMSTHQDYSDTLQGTILMHTITDLSDLLTDLSDIVTLSPTLGQLAGSLYYNIAQHLPPLLRQWYVTLDRQTASLVSRLVLSINHTIVYIYIFQFYIKMY